MSPIEKSSKLENVCYDIRGPVLKEAKRLEEEGNKVLKLNIGNPAPFGFEAPDEILVDVIRNLPTAQGYCDSKGLYSARKAIMQHYQARGMRDVTVEDIYIGNGVSELIVQAMQALLNSGDEMLVPAPDYPLWTAAVSLSSGKAVHYLCDESSDWFPDLDDIRAKITPRTRGIVIINPNNPTGAVYSKELLQEIVEIARQHNLIIFADEIYDKILYDERTVENLPRRRLPSGLDGAEWPEKTRERLYRRTGNAGLNASVRQRAGPACYPDRAGRLSEHQRIHHPRRTPV